MTKLKSNNILFGVTSEFVFLTDQSEISLFFKTEYKPSKSCCLIDQYIFTILHMIGW